MITKDMTIGELVQQYPSVVEILMDEGVSCVGCGAAYFETIEEGLASHGRSEEEVTAIVEKLNQAIPHESGDENLTITENAAAKAKELLTKKNNQAIRIGVSSGGCAGFEYHFSFENDKSENESICLLDLPKRIIINNDEYLLFFVYKYCRNAKHKCIILLNNTFYHFTMLKINNEYKKFFAYQTKNTKKFHLGHFIVLFIIVLELMAMILQNMRMKIQVKQQ